MAANLGKAYVQIVPSAKGISGAIKNVLSKEGDSAGKSSGLSLSKALGGAFIKGMAALGVAKAVSDSINMGAELQQNLGGTEAVFGQYADKIQNKAKDAYKNMGTSASDYMATANKMGSLFQGSGLSQQKSLDLTSKAMQRAADVASVMGIDMDMAMESIAGAAKGNFTMMDNLGVAMNATTLKAYALEKGINFDWNTASNAEKSELAMKMFFDRTSQYEGNFAKESEQTISGSLGAVKAAYEDMMGNLALGKDVGPAVANLTKAAATALFKNLIPAVGNIILSLPGAVSSFVTTAADIIGEQMATGMFDPAKIGEKISGAMATVADMLPGMISGALDKAIAFVDGILSGEGAFMSAISKGIDSITKVIATKGPQLVKTFYTTILPKVIELVAKIGLVILKAIPGIVMGAGKVWLTVQSAIFEGIISAISSILDKAKSAIVAKFKEIWDGVKDGASAVKDAIKGKISGAVEVIKETWSKIKTATSSAWNGIKSTVSSAASNVASKVKTSASNIKNSFVNGIKSLPGKAKSTFDSIRKAIAEKIDAAKKKVSDAASKITGLFPLHIGKIFSGLSVPTISVSGGKAPFGIGGKGSLPSFHVNWKSYAKAMANPYMFRQGRTTVFAAGDARDEMLYSKSALMKDIKKASGGNTFNITLNANGGENPEEFAERFAATLKRKMRTA